MPMHCSANVGPDGDAAVFFGLSGTGKTTLSADPTRTLIGDDEHGWGETASSTSKAAATPRPSACRREAEPEIYATTQRFGTVLENVVLDEDRVPDFDDAIADREHALRLSAAISSPMPRATGRPATRRTSSC